MVITRQISLQTKGNCDIIDITAQVAQQIAETEIENGTVTIFIAGSTAGITTIEFESGLVADFQSMWEREVPQNIHYDHNSRWGDGNGHSHVRASLLGGSLVIPFSNQRLLTGTWQQVVLVDFDNRARERQIILQIMGD